LKTISILGSTGSVGRQTVEVCRRLGWPVAGLTAHASVELLEEQARLLRPRRVAVAADEAYLSLKTALADTDIQVLGGETGVCEVAAASDHEMVVNAISGFAGLRPTLAAVQANHAVALANKETLVAGGELVMREAQRRGVPILPVDSEHSAIFQCLQGRGQNAVEKIILTASGGPFFGYDRSRLSKVGVKDALRHPNWNMGAKITVDSATLMNKGLELIEAVRLFGVEPDKIEIVVHRESIVHSAVEFADGAVIAQLGLPDMALPIQYALTYPERLAIPGPRLNLAELGTLRFARPDTDTFVCLEACRRAVHQGGLYPAVVNGAGEAAVELFLRGRISFLDIGEAVLQALESVRVPVGCTLEDIVEADKRARQYVAARF
jgi:1-deoxy-D-xylulose-5-phosphate reductoisomerase